uniref:Uncharacterized protein n=1 Tax=Leersia perrieri TaxID=77586 RepID=A0A0D9WYX7_9ORYZ
MVLMAMTPNLFDEMSYPFEAYEDDVILVMKEEKVTRDEVLRLLCDEWLDVNHRQEEKLDRIMENLNEIEAIMSKATEEISACITDTPLAATTNLQVSSSPPSEGSSSQTLPRCSTKCSNSNTTCTMENSSHISEERVLELGNGEDKDYTQYVDTPDNINLMPTKCSMICSNPDGDLNHTVAAVDTGVTTSMAPMEMMMGDDTSSSTYVVTLTIPRWRTPSVRRTASPSSVALIMLHMWKWKLLSRKLEPCCPFGPSDWKNGRAIQIDKQQQQRNLSNKIGMEPKPRRDGGGGRVAG